MKHEFGKWLMDIAKYPVTAALLASVFSDIQERWIVYVIVSCAIVLTLGLGLWFLRDIKEKEVK